MASTSKGLLRLGFLGLAVCLTLACSEEAPPPPPAGAIPAGESIGSATVTGRASFTGDSPPPEPINMSSDSVCAARGKGQTREDLIVSPDGGLKNVFVYVKSGLGDRVFAPPREPVVLDQNGCTYHPHVLGVQVNQYIDLVNSDPANHNVNAKPEKSKGFNRGMPVQGMHLKTFFSSPEIMVPFRCDYHNWMSAFVGVVAHPFFAVTGDSGGFSLEGLPAGSYRIEAWHETLGTLEQQVELPDGGSAEIAFDFKR